MKAIIITQQLKDANANDKYTKNLFTNREVGSIKIFSETPKYFYSLNYNNGSRTDGYNKLENSVHREDGIFRVVTPELLENQYLGDIFWDEIINKFTYPVLTYTAIEIESMLDESDETDASIVLNHIESGEDIFNKAYRKIWRRRNKDRDAVNKLTQRETRDLLEYLTQVFIFLRLGNFHLARREVNSVLTTYQEELLLVDGMLDTVEWLKTQIVDYFDNDYDL